MSGFPGNEISNEIANDMDMLYQFKQRCKQMNYEDKKESTPIKVQTKKYKVYLAKLKRPIGKPKTVYKVGITSSSDAMSRLTYNRWDEPNPIIETFPDIKVMNSVWVESEEEALALEQKIMYTISGSERFHNWYEPKQLSGITEMRTWNYDEVQKVFEIMKEYK